eukprot:PhF_6_TR524/c1_g1_i6/m.331/K05681/ABCG2, CD338; ATP-binding cassette, subfamily G (WHITE), member 2
MATPYETFRFSAIVRKGLSPEEADVKVEETLQELGLEHVKHQIIGTPGVVRGLSGGGRKRTNIGVELITDPAILMLDEPTSGLDSFTAEKVMRICRDLAHNGQTVICTIHQPSADIVELFDDLMLMTKGKTIYHGPAEDAFDYFKEHGFECPDTYTTTDYFMLLMQTPELHETLIMNWEKHIANLADRHAPHLIAKPFVAGEDEVLNAKSIKGAGYMRQMKELTSRSFFDMARNRFFLGCAT